MLDQLGAVLRFIHLYESPRRLDWQRRKLALEEARYGKDSPQVAWSLESLAGDLAQSGHADGAIECYRRALAIHDKLQQNGEQGIELIGMLAGLLQSEKRYAEAEPYLLRVVAGYREYPRRLSRAQFALAENYRAQRKYAQAEALLREMMKTAGPDPYGNLPEEVLMRCLIEQGKHAQADAMLRERQAAAERASEPNPELVAMLLCARYDLYLQWGRVREALACLARLERMLAAPEHFGRFHPAAGAMWRLADSLREQRRYAAEETLLKRLLAAAEKQGESDETFAHYLQALARNALARKQPAQAWPYYERLLAIDEARAAAPEERRIRAVPYLDEIVQYLCDQGQAARAEVILRRRLALEETQTSADNLPADQCIL